MGPETENVHYIPLTRGRMARVDAEDWAPLMKHRWMCSVQPNGRCYAQRGSGPSNKQKTIIMARVIMNAQPGELIDHRDRKATLDNRKHNLRRANKRLNAANSVRRGGTSKFKGVSWCAEKNLWATYCDNRYVGRYKSEEDAARAYDKAAAIAYREFAYLNFPEVDHLSSSV